MEDDSQSTLNQQQYQSLLQHSQNPYLPLSNAEAEEINDLK